MSVPVGGGSPMHVHPATDEAFQVLAGELEMVERDRAFRARAGDFVLVPRGVPHGYRATGDTPARLVFLLSPTGFVELLESGAVRDPGHRPII
ncbi:cupin domain-containing protein [Micromonospora pisi]|nr:cupin domain-containing protein [Micromonospora pisi]